MSKAAVKLKVTQVKSAIGALPVHKECIKGLGLRRIGHSVTRENSPCIKGMINKVSHLLKVEEI